MAAPFIYIFHPSSTITITQSRNVTTSTVAKRSHTQNLIQSCRWETKRKSMGSQHSRRVVHRSVGHRADERQMPPPPPPSLLLYLTTMMNQSACNSRLGPQMLPDPPPSVPAVKTRFPSLPSEIILSFLLSLRTSEMWVSAPRSCLLQYWYLGPIA